MTVADFNAHLSECKQCRENPWNLCATGEKILERAARDTAAKIAPVPKEQDKA